MAFTVRMRWELIQARMRASGGTLAVTQRAGMHRSTLTRWHKHERLPDDPTRFLRLAMALDVDPLLLFTIDKASYAELCFAMGKALLNGGVTRALRSLAFLDEFRASAAGEWPPSVLGGSFGTPLQFRWHTFEFLHDGGLGKNFYASIALRGPRVECRDAPQVWHWAYRDHLSWRTVWHPYGSVALVGDRLESFGYNGACGTVEAPGPIAVQTWFGQGDAEFRVASLHPFSAEVSREPPPGHALARFALPSKSG